MSRLSVKGSAIKLQIQINEQVKFGKIAYRPEDPISKVFHDLKRIKILPERIDEGEVRYFDRHNQELPKAQEFANSFDLSSDVNHLIKLSIPEKSIDIEETTRRADEYIRTNKEKKSKLREMSEAEAFVRNLKPIFLAIRQQNYRELPSLCDNQEYLSVMEDYAEEHRHFINLVRVYEWMVEGVILGRDLSVSGIAAAQQIKDSAKQKIQSWIRKLNNTMKDQRMSNQSWEMKEETLKKEHKQALAQLQELIQEKETEIHQNKMRFDEFQRDIDDKILQFQRTIKNLQFQNTTLENKYEQNLLKIQQYQQKKGLGQNNQNFYSNDFFKYITNKDFILNQLALTPKHCQSLLQQLKGCKPNLRNFKLLYKYSRPTTSDTFHKTVDLKDNIFLIAKTREGRIFGGFSSLPYDPSNRRHSPPDILTHLQSFLFTLYKDDLHFFPIKAGLDSLEYQEEYIIFGNEEICIDRFKCKADSLFTSHQQKYLHFSDPNSLRSYFLSNKEQTSADLTGYQLYQVTLQ